MPRRLQAVRHRSVVRDLSICRRRRGATITAGTDLDLARGEAIAIVGESGSGKSLTAKAIARLLPPSVSAQGAVRFDGLDLMALPEREMQQRARAGGSRCFCRTRSR